MDNSIFQDLSKEFINEEVTLTYTRKRLLKQIRESIISPVVTRAAKEVYIAFLEKCGEKGFPYGYSSYTLKTNLNGKTIPIFFQIYNAKKKKELLDEMPDAYNGSSSFMDNGESADVSVKVGLLNGIIPKEKWYTIHATIQHELNHIYQQFCRGETYGHTGLNVVAMTNLISGDKIRYILGTIAYIGNDSERQSFCNELYTNIIDSLRDRKFPKKEEQEAYIWLNNLQKAYQFLLNNKDNAQLFDAINTFRNESVLKMYNFEDEKNLERTGREHLSDYKKWTYSKFKSVANNTIQKFEDEIRYTVGKAIDDAAEKGLLKRFDGRDYYSLFI